MLTRLSSFPPPRPPRRALVAHWQDGNRRRTDIRVEPKPKLPAILHTCAPLRHELLEYWCATRLSCEPDDISRNFSDLENVGNWLKILPAPARRSIRGLRIPPGYGYGIGGACSLLIKYILTSQRGIAYEIEEVKPHPPRRDGRRWYEIKFL